MWILVYIFMFALGGLSVYSQATFGELKVKEKEFTVFKKDTTASAVYLYEYGKNHFEVRNNYVWLITKYHTKIKILEQEGLKYATIQIPYYHNENRREKVQKIKAITHNGATKTNVSQENIFDVDTSENWSEKRFTFPDAHVGSILEYTYEIQSPFHFNLTGWRFQEDIPKVYTEYNAKIPGNWKYNRTLLGELKLKINDAALQEDCFSVPGIAKMADCEVLKYAMENVPAFDDDEEYMLSGSNYRSRLEFELSESLSFQGYKEKFTKSWDDVDREFKMDKDIGRQLRKKNFFEKNVPSDLLSEGEELERAKKIYAFVQNHFQWNGKSGVWRNNRVKKAFEAQKGNVAEINIALINLLNAGGIKTEMMLSATRQFGLPKRTHAVMSDFNYVLAKATIAGKDYLLDATDNYLPFGMLPFRCLNYYGRVMDFNSESYWHTIEPYTNNTKNIRVQMTLAADGDNASGSAVVSNSGYYYINQQKSLATLGKEAYVAQIEEDFGDDFYITEYKENSVRPTKNLVIEQFRFEIENQLEEDKIYINPFLITFFPKNPFIASERHYPIDFGYQRHYGYTLSLTLPEGYRLKSLPEVQLLTLPGNSGSLRFEAAQQVNGSISVLFDFKLSATQYKSEAYHLIKEFFQKAVEAQTQSYIVLEKV